MEGHPADGVLHDWAEIADKGWDTLLVGNGLSINVSPKFAYESLYEEAEKATEKGPLDERDLMVFERFGTSNFEVALGKLRDAIAMAEVLEQPATAYRQRFSSVQAALGATIRGVHLKRSEVPDSTLATIKQELCGYKAIFSTSYDLLLYWATGHDEDFAAFRDCFWSLDNSFDSANCEIWPANTATYFVHGALHLIVDGAGRTRKLTGADQTLLEQFGKPISSDREARPLLITEGTARDKLRAIEGNDYLSHVYERLMERSGALLVFGHSLGDQDRHLIDAINANPDRPVAISMVREDGESLRERQSEIWGRLKTRAEDVCFFDAATHPLGAPELRRTVPWRGFRPRASRIGRLPMRERA
jgi:Domain of unknown function (DUF4917)